MLLYDLRHAGATSYRDIHGPLMRVLDRASTVCVYNAGFDMQMIQQSAARHGLDATIGADVVCIMEEYANLYTDDGRWPKLDKAATAEGVSVGGARHRPALLHESELARPWERSRRVRAVSMARSE